MIILKCDFCGVEMSAGFTRIEILNHPVDICGKCQIILRGLIKDEFKVFLSLPGEMEKGTGVSPL